MSWILPSNCRNRINRNTQFLEHNKHKSNCFHSMFIKVKATIRSFSLFPVTFKYFHLLKAVYFNSIYIFFFSQKNSSLGLSVRLFFPKPFAILAYSDLKVFLTSYMKASFWAAHRRSPSEAWRKQLHSSYVVSRRAFAPKHTFLRCTSIGFHVIKKLPSDSSGLEASTCFSPTLIFNLFSYFL